MRAYQSTRCGLALVWANGAGAFAGLRYQQERFYYRLYDTAGPLEHAWGSAMDLSNPGLMHELNWVRLALTPTELVYSSSSDGETWVEDWRVPRPVEFSGAPAKLRLGANPDGRDDVYDRGHFDVVYFDDLFVGRQ